MTYFKARPKVVKVPSLHVVDLFLSFLFLLAGFSGKYKAPQRQRKLVKLDLSLGSELDFFFFLHESALVREH